MSEDGLHKPLWGPVGERPGEDDGESRDGDSAAGRRPQDDGEAETLTGEPVLEGGAQQARRLRDRDPRERPADPAGTRPKFAPESLLPARPESVALLDAGTTAAPPVTPSLAAQSVGGGGGGGGEVAVAAGAGELGQPVGVVQTRHAPRFQFLLGALAAVAAAAIFIAVAIVSSPKPAPPPPWSSWRPVSNDVDPAQQIAAHVAPEYRLDNGDQLVQVAGGPLSLGGQPALVALRLSGSQPAELPGNGVFYQLCGSGPSCSISEGKPSAQRLLLIRREALELALYTFRYVSGVNQVVVTIPPPPPTSSTAGSSSGSTAAAGAASASTTGSATSSSSTTPNRALFFRPGDVAPELDRPLAFTLSAHTPTVSTVTHSTDAGLVASLTSHNLYDVTVVQDQQSNPVLLLQPPGLGG